MSDETYDVVIVGAGIAGAILAKTLSNAGKSVLILEAGDGVDGIALEGQEAFEVHQGYLNTFYEAAVKVPNAPYPNLPETPSPNVLDIEPIKSPQPSTKGYFVQYGPMPFASDYTRTPGGSTLHWLGTCLRMLPNDFRMQTQYGVGVDWPITYDELRPYYEMAEQEIGVSADVDDLYYPNTGPDFFGVDYVYPMKGLPQSYLDQKFKKAVGDLKIDVSDGAGSINKIEVRVTPTPQGRNSTPNAEYRKKGLRWDSKKKKLVWESLCAGDTYEPIGANWHAYTGQRCEGNASCVPICPVQAKYNALKTLKSAAQKNVTIVPRAVAFEVEVEAQGGGADRQVTGIKYKQYKNPEGNKYEVKVARGKRYVLAAHAVENAKLLLASGIANSSDQVGRNLMDHVTLLTWGLMNEPIYPFRGPGSTSNLPVFRDAEFRKEHAAFIVTVDNWGWGWSTFSPDSDLKDAVKEEKFGKQLKSYLENKLTRQVLLHFECEQLPEPENRVTIDDKYRDKLDNYQPVIHYDISNYLKKAFAAGKKISDQLFEHAGIKDHSAYCPEDSRYFCYDGQEFFYRGAGHLVGTHRMGDKRENSVVNRDQRTWDHSNLFLVGCGNMATLGTSNPTLTMAALAFWAAENILKDLSGLTMAGQTSYRKRQFVSCEGEPTIALDKRVKNVYELRTLLQDAVALELSTIPPYLCALYSIKDGTNQQAAEILQSVVMEEMLHMALAANVLNAIGGHPVIYDKGIIREYPTKLPGLGSGIEVHLDRFSQDSITTFFDIERPDYMPLDQPTGCKCIGDYRSIGQFYEAIDLGLKELWASEKNIFTGNPALQLTPEHYYGGGGKATCVTNLDSALEAIKEIIGQGEGVQYNTIWGAEKLHPGVEDFVEVAHFFRLDQILKAKQYKEGDRCDSGPTGETLKIEWDKVYPMRKNPTMKSCPPGSQLLEKTTACNRTYMSLLKLLQDATNGKPELLMQSVAIMYELKYRAIELMKIPMPCGNETAGPSFEYLPPG